MLLLLMKLYVVARDISCVVIHFFLVLLKYNPRMSANGERFGGSEGEESGEGSPERWYVAGEELVDRTDLRSILDARCVLNE